MQGIVLCPKCGKQAKKDAWGELLCPECGKRLCPKAHLIDGKICPHCGWEDPNYYLWQKAQRAQVQSSTDKKSDEPAPVKAQYICPNCGASVDIARKDCPSCGLLGAKYRAKSAAAADIASTPIAPPTPAKAFLDKAPPFSPKGRTVLPTRSPIFQDIAKTERRAWRFSSARRFLQPVGASLLAGIVLSGLILGVYKVAPNVYQFFRQRPNEASSPISPPPPISKPTKTYILTTSVPPNGGGIIHRSPDLVTYLPGTEVRLTAVPDECHAFNYWEGVTSGSSENITITVDSNKSVTAYFKPKDTTPPVISKVEVSRYSDVGATITWATNEPATSRLEYGKTRDYGQSAKYDKGATTSHKIRLTGLEPFTTYYFKAQSVDKCGNGAAETGMLATLREAFVGDMVGDRAPDFTLPYYHDDNPSSPNKGNKTFTLREFRGEKGKEGKKILLNFWNTYCGACIGEFPYIRAIYELKRPDLEVITVCIDGRADRIVRLEEKYCDQTDENGVKIGRFTFPILLDSEDKTVNDYRISSIPKTVFIDEDGIIREIRNRRFKDTDEILADIQKYLP